MRDDEIVWSEATELAGALRSGAVTVAQVAEAFIARISEVNPIVNAYVGFDPDAIRERAAALDAKRDAGEELGPIFGVPYSIKMLTSMEGLPASGGLLPQKDLLGTHDAVVSERLRDADGLFLGQTNAPETGYYGGTDNHVFGPTHNPWKQGYSAGGSSGGAAAAVAAGLGPLAEGADGAGSVRIPASMCGVVGFKPSLGRIPHTLLEGRFYTHIFHGPIARTARDCALMLDVMAGESAADPLSLPDPLTPYSAQLDQSPEGWRIAYSEDLGTGVHVDPEVAEICRTAVAAFAGLGAKVTDATPAWEQPEQAMWHALWVPGYASEVDLVDWDAHRDDVDPELYELIKTADELTLADYGRADVTRGRMYDTYTAFMADYDFIVSPTLASASYPLGRFAPEHLDGTSLQSRLLAWLLTYPFNMLTVPAITIPAGFTSDGRPVGIQVAGRFRADADVLAAGVQLQEALGVPTQATVEP